MAKRVYFLNRERGLLAHTGVVLGFTTVVVAVSQSAAGETNPAMPFALATDNAPGDRHRMGAVCTTRPDEAGAREIERRREAFNRGIETQDIAVIADVLNEDVVLITGSDSNVFRGSEEQLALWRGDFANPERLIYRRTPVCIETSPATGLATEYGRWTGVRRSEAAPLAAGAYTAKWRRVADRWMLEAELFTTRDCSGDYCPSR